MAMQVEKDLRHDPGDAVPPGVAPEEPVPLTEEDRKVKRELEKLGDRPGAAATATDGSRGRAETPGPEKRGS